MLLAAQRDANVRLARDINSYWRARGVEANARVVFKTVEVGFAVEAGMKVPLDVPQRVLSHEIVSDLKLAVPATTESRAAA